MRVNYPIGFEEKAFVVDPSAISIFTDDADPRKIWVTNGEAREVNSYNGRRINPGKVSMIDHVGATSLGDRTFDELLEYLNGSARLVYSYGAPEHSDGRRFTYQLPDSETTVEIILRDLARKRKGFPGLVGIPRGYGNVDVVVAEPFGLGYKDGNGNDREPGDRPNDSAIYTIANNYELAGRVCGAQNTANAVSREIISRIPASPTNRDSHVYLMNSWRRL